MRLVVEALEYHAKRILFTSKQVKGVKKQQSVCNFEKKELKISSMVHTKAGIYSTPWKNFPS